MATRYKKIRTPDGRIIDEHRYVMECHIRRRLDRREAVHHINGDGRDNRFENLQLMKLSDHSRMHMIGTKRPDKTPEERRAISLRMAGEKTNFHKLTAAEVVEIRRCRAMGISYTELGDRFNVHPVTIRRACTGEHWQCVPMTASQLPTP
jgi:hypothetical protein